MNASQMRIYLDTSALVKLVVVEAESVALQNFLAEQRHDTLFSAALARTELIRAVSRTGPKPLVTHATSCTAWTSSR